MNRAKVSGCFADYVGIAMRNEWESRDGGSHFPPVSMARIPASRGHQNRATRHRRAAAVHVANGVTDPLSSAFPFDPPLLCVDIVLFNTQYY